MHPIRAGDFGGKHVYTGEGDREQRSRSVITGAHRIETGDLVRGAGIVFDLDIALIVGLELPRGPLKIILRNSVSRSRIGQGIKVWMGEEKLCHWIDNRNALVPYERCKGILWIIELDGILTRQEGGEIAVAHRLSKDAGLGQSTRVEAR